MKRASTQLTSPTALCGRCSSKPPSESPSPEKGWGFSFCGRLVAVVIFSESLKKLVRATCAIRVGVLS